MTSICPPEPGVMGGGRMGRRAGRGGRWVGGGELDGGGKGR